MSFSFYSLLGALAFLIIGLIELATVRRFLYPLLRWRYEKAKLTQTQGTDPDRIMNLLRVQSLIVLPVAGLLFGDRLKALWG